jgi:hypothetical protein
MNTKIAEAILIEGTNRQEYCGYPIIKESTQARKVAILDKSITVSPAQLIQGFKWLGRWEAISPFRPYQELASDFMKGKSQQEIINLGLGDLRIPLFDPRLIFVLTNERTTKMLKRYQELKAEWDPRIAFIAAAWETKPLIKPLPAEKWII